MSTPIENNTEELRNILQQVNELPNAGNTPLEAVLYVEQTLTDEQKAQARKNIGAADESDIGEIEIDEDLSALFGFAAGYLSKTGDFVAYSDAGCTDYIPVYPGDMFIWGGASDLNNSLGVAEYDSDKKFIGGSPLATVGYSPQRNIPYTVKKGRFVRFSSFFSAHTLAKMKNYEGITELVDKTDEYLVNAEEGMLNKTNGAVNAMAGALTTAMIPVLPGEKYLVSGYAGSMACGVAFYDSLRSFMAAGLNNADHSAYQAEDAAVIIPAGAAYARFSTLYASSHPLRVQKYEYVSLKQAMYLLDKAVTVAKTGNVLCGKKYVACGDSFTEGPFSAKNGETWDDTLGVYKTYPWHIATRNGMTLVNEAKSGSTMYNNGNANAFSVTRYTKIPTDADYITLCFGLNDDAGTIGTLSDTTNATVMGAWNVVLEHLITNMPYAKIGIIIPDAWISTAMRDAIIDVAEYWGIPYLDMSGDPKVPLLIGGRRSGPTLSAKAIELRTAAFAVSAEDNHPNPKGHAYRSTIIENFIRSL